MQTEETPDRRPEEPQTEHHFETPVVREARPARTTFEERDDGDDAGPQQGPPQERDMAFLHRWESVQTVFVACCRHRRAQPA